MIPPPRLLYVAPSSFTLAHHLRGQIQFLTKQGYDIDVVCADDTRAREAAARENARLVPVAIDRYPFSLRSVSAYAHLVRLMRRRRYGVVNCSTKNGGLLGALAARRAGVPGVVYIVRGLARGPVHATTRHVFLTVERMICRLADRVVMLGYSTMDLFLQRGVCPREKMVVLGGGSENGIDIDRFSLTANVRAEASRLRDSLGVGAGDQVFGFVGRLDRSKGIAELAEAWALLRRRFERTHLLLLAPVERDPSLVDSLARLGEDRHVHSLGFMPDPRAAYAAMDCLVLPSYGEGFPNVVLEAAAMERPTIATNVPGCVDAIVDEVTGLLVEARSAVALAAGLERFLIDPAAGGRWGQMGRQRSVTLFRQELIWKALAELYSDLLSPHPRETSHA